MSDSRNNNTVPGKRYDLTEEGSKRSDEEATNIARQLENDDQGGVPLPDDDIAENKVATSLDDE
jgi:hypothetical protein